MPALDSTTTTAAEPHPADTLANEQLDAIAELPPEGSRKMIVNQDDLENILREVELARQVVQTCAQALQHMNVDQSDEVGNVLMHHGSDAIVGPLDALREILCMGAFMSTTTVPQALLAHLSLQQTRASELQALLEMLEKALECDRKGDVAAIAARMALEINEGLDHATLYPMLGSEGGEAHA